MANHTLSLPSASIQIILDALALVTPTGGNHPLWQLQQEITRQTGQEREGANIMQFWENAQREYLESQS